MAAGYINFPISTVGGGNNESDLKLVVTDNMKERIHTEAPLILNDNGDIRILGGLAIKFKSGIKGIVQMYLHAQINDDSLLDYYDEPIIYAPKGSFRFEEKIDEYTDKPYLEKEVLMTLTLDGRNDETFSCDIRGRRRNFTDFYYGFIAMTITYSLIKGEATQEDYDYVKSLITTS